MCWLVLATATSTHGAPSLPELRVRLAEVLFVLDEGTAEISGHQAHVFFLIDGRTMVQEDAFADLLGEALVASGVQHVNVPEIVHLLGHRETQLGVHEAQEQVLLVLTLHLFDVTGAVVEATHGAQEDMALSVEVEVADFAEDLLSSHRSVDPQLVIEVVGFRGEIVPQENRPLFQKYGTQIQLLALLGS